MSRDERMDVRVEGKQMLECVGGPDDGKHKMVDPTTQVLFHVLPQRVSVLDVSELPPFCKPRIGHYVRKRFGYGKDKPSVPILHWEGEEDEQG